MIHAAFVFYHHTSSFSCSVALAFLRAILLVKFMMAPLDNSYTSTSWFFHESTITSINVTEQWNWTILMMLILHAILHQPTLHTYPFVCRGDFRVDFIKYLTKEFSEYLDFILSSSCCWKFGALLRNCYDTRGVGCAWPTQCFLNDSADHPSTIMSQLPILQPVVMMYLYVIHDAIATHFDDEYHL